MIIRGIALAAALAVSSVLMAAESVCSPVQTVDEFVAVLKSGNREAALGFYAPCNGEAKQHIGKWLDKALPFFSSGKVETKAENVCFIDGDVAISPIRQWRPAEPDIFEIEIACLVFKDGKWLLLPELEKINGNVNADYLLNERFKRLENLWHLFWNYKRIQKDKVQKAREGQVLKQMQQGQ